MEQWSHKRRVSLLLSNAAREQISVVATRLGVSQDVAADALLRALDYHEADLVASLVIDEDRRALENP